MRKIAIHAIAKDNLDNPVLKENFSGDLGKLSLKCLKR
jgi:hypothetical protein